MAGTRSWAEAEKKKRDLEDQLSGASAPRRVRRRSVAKGRAAGGSLETPRSRIYQDDRETLREVG